MGYNNDVYETAYKILEERRDRNKYLKEKRKEEIFISESEKYKIEFF